MVYSNWKLFLWWTTSSNTYFQQTTQVYEHTKFTSLETLDYTDTGRFWHQYMKTSLAHWPVKQWYTFADYYLSLEFIYQKMSTRGIQHQHAPPSSVSFPPDVNCPADIYTCIKPLIKVKAFLCKLIVNIQKRSYAMKFSPIILHTMQLHGVDVACLLLWVYEHIQ